MTDLRKYDLDVFNGGQHYDLNPRGTRLPRLVLIGIEGHTLAAYRDIESKAAGQLGTTSDGFEQGSRPLTLFFRILAETVEDYDLMTDLIVEALQRYTQTSKAVLTFTRRNGAVRAIEGNMEGDINLHITSRRHTVQDSFAVRVKCGDPRFYEPELITVTLTPLADVDGWKFSDVKQTVDGWKFGNVGQTVTGWQFGGSDVDGQVTFTYAEGQRTAAPEFPTLILYGPITGPTITQVTTGERITFSSDFTIEQDAFVTINLADGPFSQSVPTVTDSDGNSILHQIVDAATDLSRFHIAPAGEDLPDGTFTNGSNIFRLEGTGGANSTRLDILYKRRFKKL